MQLAATPSTLSPLRPTLEAGAVSSLDAKPSPFASPRRRSRSLRLSGASISSPQTNFNKENLGVESLSSPSTSAKTLDVAPSAHHQLTSPIISSPLSRNPTRNPSQLKSKSSPIRHATPLHRPFVDQSNHILSSSDESDDSTLVFFGKPSSAEKKKRVHYQQRVLDKRLRHKDSLDLARQRPISFNPDDTMLIDDQTTFGWTRPKATPTPSNMRKYLLTAQHQSPFALESPTLSRSSARSSSPNAAPVLASQDPIEDPPNFNVAPPVVEEKAVATSTDVIESPVAADAVQTAHTEQAEEVQETVELPEQVLTLLEQQPATAEIQKHTETNPFIATRSSPSKTESPSKHQLESPRRHQSPVRSVETLIGATMTLNRDLVSPTRSPRRSPRLSLRALQMSQSPAKAGPINLHFGPSTPFQQAPLLQHSTPFHPSTPSQHPAILPSIPPSTGLSRFACLQNVSQVTQVPLTPANRALSFRSAHQTPILPSPFISTGFFQLPTASNEAVAPVQQSPSRSPVSGMRPASPAKWNVPPSNGVVDIGEQSPTPKCASRNASPSKIMSAPGTPLVRFIEPEPHSSPQKMVMTEINDKQDAARSPSPIKIRAEQDLAKSAERLAPQPELLSSPIRHQVDAVAEVPATPSSALIEASHGTPGPTFRQTARRVPIKQHEADFGVKVSPEKPSYSPRKAYANSSARQNEFGAKAERIPARRVQVPPPQATRQVSAKQNEQPTSGAVRVASVASKAARTVSAGASRFGGQTGSLPSAMLSRPGLNVSSSSSSAPPGAALRVVSSAQSSSVASKANRVQRPASSMLTSKPPSPTKQARSLSGLPRPKWAPATAAPAGGPGSRLPRPATLSSVASTSRVPSTSASRPVPMAIARLAPAQQGLQRTVTSTVTSRPPSTASSIDEVQSPDALDTAMPETEKRDAQANTPSSAAGIIVSSDKVPAQKMEEKKEAPLAVRHAQPATKSSASTSVEAAQRTHSAIVSQTLQSKPSRLASRADKEAAAASARSSSPVIDAPPLKPLPSTRSAPPVVLDPEQQRLRCLAMQEKARSRATKTNAPSSSDVEEPQPGEAGPNSSLQASASEHASSSSPPTSDAALSSPARADAATTSASAGRPLRSARVASRSLTPSATRVAPSRGRALSLNDIIAARKVDVPLSLTDQLRLADTVNKKHNEKTLARYKVTKIQRPFERPPSPDRHDHEPEACTIIDDFSSHRQGKGDLAPYSTPVKYRAYGLGEEEGRKCVRWYRPLFVGKGAQYGPKLCESKPALKPIQYELDRMGNKVPTGDSPKLSKGQLIVIYRNYFKGEPEPADD